MRSTFFFSDTEVLWYPVTQYVCAIFKNSIILHKFYTAWVLLKYFWINPSFHLLVFRAMTQIQIRGCWRRIGHFLHPVPPTHLGSIMLLFPSQLLEPLLGGGGDHVSSAAWLRSFDQDQGVFVEGLDETVFLSVDSPHILDAQQWVNLLQQCESLPVVISSFLSVTVQRIMHVHMNTGTFGLTSQQ